MKPQLNLNDLKNTLNKKCLLRSIPVPTMEMIKHHENRQYLESEWAIQLKHQVPTLLPFDDFIEELPELFQWLEAEPQKM